MKINKRNLDLFFKFMHERHSIWVRRFMQKVPPPWTKDKILRDNKFTNVYRELDRGTIWYVSHVYPNAYGCWKEDLGKAERNVIWCTVQYRLMNRIETFKKVGFVPYWDWVENNQVWIDSLAKLMKEGISIFTSAHRTCPTHKPGQTRLQVFHESLDYTNDTLHTLWGLVKRATSLETVFQIFQEIPNVGDFISYEICCDLILVRLIPFGEDDWANAGPGAKAGLKIIFPDAKDFLALMKLLRDQQAEHFKRLELDFPYFHKDKLLTLRSIEHSLCEFSKYYRCLHGGRTRVAFKPSDTLATSQGQWPIRWPRLKNENGEQK